MAARVPRAEIALSFNTSGYGTTTSTSAGAESTVYTINFVAPASGAVQLTGNLTCTLPINNGVLQAWLDVASGPSNSRQSGTFHSHTSTTRGTIPLQLRVSGLTPGQTYAARWRWNGPAGTTRSMTSGDNEQAYILIHNYSA